MHFFNIQYLYLIFQYAVNSTEFYTEVYHQPISSQRCHSVSALFQTTVYIEFFLLLLITSESCLEAFQINPGLYILQPSKIIKQRYRRTLRTRDFSYFSSHDSNLKIDSSCFSTFTIFVIIVPQSNNKISNYTKDILSNKLSVYLRLRIREFFCRCSFIQKNPERVSAVNIFSTMRKLRLRYKNLKLFVVSLL